MPAMNGFDSLSLITSSFRRIGGALVLLVLFTTSAGCVEKMRFKYVSLENVDGIQVEMYEKPDLRHTQLMESKFPTHYRLNRSAYSLRFTIAKDKFSPHIWIEAVMPSGKKMRVKSRPDRLSKRGRARPCGTYSEASPTASLRFDWVICGSNAEPDEMRIAFDVQGAEGEVIGTEDIQFQLSDNGFYFPPDGP
jgi:hypothetical protein